MENGSGGFMSDLVFNGGAFGMWVSNQQFTARNIQISNAGSAIYQLWDWGWTWQNVQITDCNVGFDLATGGLTLGTQTAGGVLILDSEISNTPLAIRTSSTQTTSFGGSIFLDNVQLNDVTTGLIDSSGNNIIGGGTQTITQWAQGNLWGGSTTSPDYVQAAIINPPTKPSSLTSSGKIFTRSRPQYQEWAPSQFISVKSNGAHGNGVTDDTAALNAIFAKFSGCGIIYFDAGVYLVSNTITVPVGTIVVGELYSTILGTGSAFSDQSTPTPVLRVGNPGDTGVVEISDIVVSTTGGSQGAVGIEWNVDQSSQGSAGMWDVHVRLGGATGTNINVENCIWTSPPSMSTCASAFLGIHITGEAAGYFENIWVWNADHDLDDPNQTRINSLSGRGILSESAEGPIWLFGTASEHHILYQYGFVNSQNVFAGLIQTDSIFPTDSRCSRTFRN